MTPEIVTFRLPQSSILTALVVPGCFGSGSDGTAKAIVVDGIGERPTTTAGGEVDALKPPGGALYLFIYLFSNKVSATVKG